jgi:hypothetical protein
MPAPTPQPQSSADTVVGTAQPKIRRLVVFTGR